MEGVTRALPELVVWLMEMARHMEGDRTGRKVRGGVG